jgi:hypothetical protein
MCIAFRAASVCFGTPNYHAAYAASHDRIDALFIGVLLDCFYHYPLFRFSPALFERNLVDVRDGATLRVPRREAPVDFGICGIGFPYPAKF